jgi:hypothetical protein
MYLDTTILQSRTTDTLIEFIDELFEIAGDYKDKPMNDLHTHEYVTGKYSEIKRQQRKAKKQEEKEVSI